MNIIDQTWAPQIAEKIKKKMLPVATRNIHKVPYTTSDGVYNDMTEKDITWWTNGFWGGIMWQLYHATGEEIYKTNALELEEKQDRNLMDHRGMDHDSGFRWLPTSGAHYRLTQDEASLNRIRLAADNMAGRFNPAGNFIRAWNDNGDSRRIGWAIIDCMMNLPLLYWMTDLTGDPRYTQMAVRHADTAMENFVRGDGSVNHIVEFNPQTGEFVRSYGGQGYGEGSSWTRGQAWGVYGFTLSYIHTGDEKYLQCAKKIADYFISRTPEGRGIPVDFCQPQDCTWEDSTAAAIAACGMLEIAKHSDETEGKAYYDAALSLLHFLEENRCDWTQDCDNIVERCTAAYHDQEHEFAIIYGDYYFIEAIWKLTGEEFFIW